MFNNVTDVRIGGGTFIVNNNTEIGISALKQASVLSATHDSFERYPPPECNMETRKTALVLVDLWVEEMAEKYSHLAHQRATSGGTPGFPQDDEPLQGLLGDESSGGNINPSASQGGRTPSLVSPEEISMHERILWLHAPAGAGKSAVAQTVAKRHAERQHLGASFFFSRGAPGRDTARHLFPTIAYQIAMQIPSFRASIGDAVQEDLSIFDKSLDAQVHHLLILPFESYVRNAQKLPPHPSPSLRLDAPAPTKLFPPFLVVLDGLDECGTKVVQCGILSHILDLLYQHDLPLCFLIVSRPEPHIRNALQSGAFGSRNFAEVLSLYADINPEEADMDIRAFLRTEFDRIYHSESYHELMSSVAQPWPSLSIIDDLAKGSGGYFLYVATAIRFIDREFFSPVESLNMIMNPSSSDTFFLKIDELYHQILSINPNRLLLMRILAFIFVASLPLEVPAVGSRPNGMIEQVLGLRTGTVQSVLTGMHSLLRVKETVKSYHPSFQVFLFDKRRARHFFIDPSQYYDDLALLLSPRPNNISKSISLSVSDPVTGSTSSLLRLSSSHHTLDRDEASWDVVTSELPTEDRTPSTLLDLGGDRQKLDPDSDITRKDPQISAIVVKLKTVLSNDAEYRRLLACQGPNAQKLLDLFQRLLDTPELGPAFRRSLVVATQRLSAKADLYPTCYKLKNIVPEGQSPVEAGGFADIYKGMFQGQAVSVKVIRIYQTTIVTEFLKECSKEAILWGQLSHPNVLPMYGLYRLRKTVCLVSPWMGNGHLNKYLKRQPSASRVLLAADVIEGLNYLHKSGIIHGDLKGANVLVDDLGRARLTDFGLSSISDSKIPAWSSHSSVGSKGGSVRWQAPELFDPASDQVVKNSVASDVYALSCVFFEIFTGAVPFAHISLDHTVVVQIKSGARPARPLDLSPSWGLTENIWSLMQACWEADPVKRPTLDDVNARMTMEIPFDSRSAGGESTLSPAHFRKRLSKKFNIMSVSTLESLLHHDGDGSSTVPEGTKSKVKRLFRMFQ